MKDSQRRCRIDLMTDKYIKVNNERFSTVHEGGVDGF